MKTTAVAALLLLGLTSAASADCAWVLWEQQEHLHWSEGATSATFWKIHAARQSEADCETVLTRVWKVGVESWKDKGGKFSSAPGYFSVSYEKESYGYNFYCLPDTVDPRGPKGRP